MSQNGQPRIGVFVCDCGTNIAGKVDVPGVVAFAAKLDNVAVAKEYKFMCSDPGQGLIIQSIKDYGLNRVVVASCSPLMHEPTFRGATAEGGLNPFYFQMANIREQVSWVTSKPEDATKKAKALISAAVRRVALHDPLIRKEVPVRPEVLIVGGGIAGIQAALTYAKSGKKVYLVEQQPSIGGHMSQLDKTFPTLDCSACILTPKMSEVGKHPNIELLTWSEVEEISGYVGNFKAKIRKKARYVDIDKCNGCGACWENCPTTVTPSERIIRKGKMIIKRVDKETSIA
jgi:heterodisulfide reductase subunit A